MGRRERINLTCRSSKRGPQLKKNVSWVPWPNANWMCMFHSTLARRQVGGVVDTSGMALRASARATHYTRARQRLNPSWTMPVWYPSFPGSRSRSLATSFGAHTGVMGSYHVTCPTSPRAAFRPWGGSFPTPHRQGTKRLRREP